MRVLLLSGDVHVTTAPTLTTRLLHPSSHLHLTALYYSVQRGRRQVDRHEGSASGDLGRLARLRAGELSALASSATAAVPKELPPSCCTSSPASRAVPVGLDRAALSSFDPAGSRARSRNRQRLSDAAAKRQRVGGRPPTSSRSSSPRLTAGASARARRFQARAGAGEGAGCRKQHNSTRSEVAIIAEPRRRHCLPEHAVSVP